MKLILKAAVDKLGVPGDIVEVKAGYGRNYLLPRGLAMPATRGAEKQIEAMRKARAARQIKDLDHAREVKQQLEALEGITVSVRTSEKGKLFGSVSAEDITAAIKAAGGPALNADTVEIAKGQVKTTGRHSVEINLHDDIAATVNVEVVSA